MSKKSFISGAIILMAAGFVVRILGFVYRIYLSNLIGAEGMGLFQLISPVYSLIILTLTSGVSIAVSKMVAEELAANHVVNLRRITGCALAVVIAAGIGVSLFIGLFNGYIVNGILKDSRTYYSVMLLIPCIPTIAAASALKGYFYGIQEVVPTAISQIVEQIVKIGLVMGMAGYLARTGLEYACALATVGMAAGEISNLAVLYIVYHYKKRHAAKDTSKNGFMRKRRIMKELVLTAMPISFNRFIMSAMSAVEMILIPRRLLAGGLDYSTCIEEYGRLTGMAMPLIFFPSLVTSSLATTLVPAISEAMSLKNFRTLNYRISKSIKLTFIIGFIFTGIFTTYPNEIGHMVYRRENIGGMLYMMSFSCIFLYLQQTLLGTLNGLGKQAVSLRNSVIGSAIRIGFVYFCIPVYGIPGYVWGMAVSSACVCVLNLKTVVKMTGMYIDIRNWIVKPGAIGLVMFFIGKYVYSFFTILKLGSSWTTCFAVIGNVAVALMLMAATGVFNREDVKKILKNE